MTKEELLNEYNSVKAEYENLKAQGLSIDMSRGKPGADQLDISDGMLDALSDGNFKCENGLDVRNYGVLDGIPECKRLFADLLEVKPENIIVGGNSSLSLMFDYVAQCLYMGAGFTPWSQQGEVKFLCPCPGYDRHFAICEYLGIEMINIPMTEQGPDMDVIEEAVKDSSVKGMFCVPKYSNPQGITFSAETVKRIANLDVADDFRIIWDNAYCVHDLTDTTDELLNIFDVLPEKNKNMVVEVASTSKISYPGAGVACIATSVENIVDADTYEAALLGGTFTEENAKYGQALKLAGGDANGLSIPNIINTGTNSYSISMWYKQDSANKMILAQQDGVRRTLLIV
ncbi:MAG: aminotransferase class I/II-fold pyridoxal phosphate-dependent enzyme, partial [Clostridia bacterium]|nr:aminotransferase class I/II-fold pyridoxal phosphate-dependent enzyme [Clostridia bacterium]